MNITVKAFLGIAVAVTLCSAVACDFGLNPEPEGSISGKVYTPVATEDNKIVGRPKPGALVTLGSCGISGHTVISKTCTRSDGSFSFKGLDEGGYCIYIGTDDPGSWYLGVSGYPVEVAANQSVEMDSLFTFGYEDYLICGVARYADGHAYTNDVIEFYASVTQSGERTKIGTRVTSEDGSYAFSGSNCPEYIWFESPKGIVAVNQPASPEYAISYFKPWTYGYLPCDLTILEAVSVGRVPIPENCSCEKPDICFCVSCRSTLVMP